MMSVEQQANSTTSHPSGVGVCLTNHIGKFTFPNGRSEERRMQAGEVFWLSGEVHLPENISDAPLELILVELKTKPGTVEKAVKAKPTVRAKARSAKGKNAAKPAKGKRAKRR